MKAFLLAAGKGTRLLPLTKTTPKCLVPLGGKPILDYWFEIFEKHGIDEIFMNISHLAEKVEEHVAESVTSVKVNLGFEEVLLGSGGTIKQNHAFVAGEKEFFILYADHLTQVDLTKILEFHRDHHKPVTLGLFHASHPEQCGIVEVDDGGIITSFVEKPEKPKSDLAFAGVMVCGAELFDYFPDEEVFDLGFHLLPKLAGNAAGFVLQEYHRDIGTPERLAHAEHDLKTGIVVLE